ncbi:hypothetical protein B0H13DRAFT_1711711 [Mycena leptocephala]|nr:hypothetical protein B0H13DRAFT_1711711 [Mycena leptocephala]
MNRDLTLELLRCMGVELPPKTKLPDDELDKRLSKTLDGCQYLTRVVPVLPLNPASYKSWHLDKSNKPVFDAVRRQNIGESSFVYDKLKEGNLNPFPLYVDPFMDLRQSIMTMGKNWDDEHASMMLADKEQTSCIFIRIVEVLEFDKQTPILMVLFRRELRGIQPSESVVKWILFHEDDEAPKEKMGHIFATAKEQLLFLRLLQRNSERLPASYKPKRTALERDFVPSFILPVGPLGGKEVARFNNNDGCSVCGEPARSKCSRCNVKRYCGAVCQKEDWKTHRPTCTSLKGAKWHTVPFVPHKKYRKLADLLGALPFLMSRHDCLEHQMDNHDEPEVDPDAPPPNTHGSTPFVVKMQLNSANSGISILIYDRRRSFEVTLTKYICPDSSFNLLAELVKTKGRRGLKIFCWATRSGDWSLDLCVDQLPEWQQW